MPTTEPLHMAVEKGDLNHVRKLLDSDVKPDVKDVHHRTPLMIAAKKGAMEIAKILIEHGANVNAKDKRSSVWEGRCSPLHFACDSNRVEMAGLLIDAGADPDSHSEDWHIPLSKAIYEKGREKLIDLLLEKGANPNGPLKCSETPLRAAALMDNLPLVKRLLQLGADPNRVVREPALHATNSIECTRELIAAGADPNLKDIDGFCLFHHRITVLDPEFLTLLIQSGANVNMVADYDKGTPLHYLTRDPNLNKAKILIESGANINALDKEKKTPLDRCEEAWKRACDSLGAGLNSADKYREFGLGGLVETGLARDGERTTVYKNMAELLRQHGGKTSKNLEIS